MCGIAGLFREAGLNDGDQGLLRKAMEKIRLRGPDGDGVFVSDRLILGHTRLAIVDPDAGQQPWVHDESGVVLVYNGEIYNGDELRRELESREHSFRSHCDTEVLLHAYLEWGSGCLGRIRGIYAFAMFDPRDDSLWLVRDRLGVKPLYYRNDAGSWSFASSLAALNALSGESPRWDPDGVSHYLMTARTELGARTLFEGAWSVEPGACIRVDFRENRSTSEVYWEVPKLAAADKLESGLSDQVGRCRELVESAVKEQLISSDVPVGGFLSGGIDSAILCGTISRHQKRFTAYSIGYDRSSYNEWEAMQVTAEANRIDWKRIVAKENDFWDDWAWLVGNRGAALSTPNEIPIYRMSKAFSSECKVALTGEGADEIFGGYAGPTFCAFDYDRSIEGAVSDAALIRAYGKSRFKSRREHFLLANSWIQPEALSAGFPALRDATDGFSGALSWYDGFFDSVGRLTTFDAYLHLHARVNLEGLLNRLDSSTMGASIEGRVPFTDHRIAEYLFVLPDELKMGVRSSAANLGLEEMNAFELDAAGAVETKRLLRESFRGRVPDEILRRRKVSFPVPFLELLTGELAPKLEDIWRQAPAIAALTGVARLSDSVSSQDPGAGLRAWLLVNLALLEMDSRLH